MYHFSKKTQNLHFLHFGQWTSFDLCITIGSADQVYIVNRLDN
jgi:hypothetical protein